MPEQNEPSIHTRPHKLASVRTELTNDPTAVQSLESALAQVKSSNVNLIPSNSSDFQRTAESVDRIASKALAGETPSSPELLTNVAETYFALGEKLAPFYGDFAKWVNTFQDSDRATEFVFQGRDSLGFFVAFSQLYGNNNSQYSPVTRNTLHFYGLESSKAQQRLARLKDDYTARGVMDKKQVFVDFGFMGSNPRKELMLATKLFGTTPDADILLAYYTKDGHDSAGFDYIWNNFKGNERANYRELNAQLLDRTRGYINTFFPEFARHMQGDPYLREALQELSSYIKESPDTTRAEGSSNPNDYVVASAYELAAKYSFCKGLVSRFKTGVDVNPEAARESLNLFHQLYSNTPALFTAFKDYSTRYMANPKYKEMIDELNKELTEAGQLRYQG